MLLALRLFVRTSVPELEGVGFSKFPSRKRFEDLATDVGIPTSRRYLLFYSLQAETEIFLWEELQGKAAVRWRFYGK